MPVIVTTTQPTTTSVQTIMDGTAQDIRQVLASTAGSTTAAILLDYCNRISLQMLRASAWNFVLSQPIRFITQMNVSNYWIGAVGAGTPGTAETNLGIADLRRIKEDSVMDRTNFRALLRTEESPLIQSLAFPDSSSRQGTPKVYRNDSLTPYVLNLYPAPDNQGTFQPVPEAPICYVTPGGSMGPRFYYLKITYIDSFGNESSQSLEVRIFIPDSYLINVALPVSPVISASGVTYDRMNVYAGTVSGSETKRESKQTAYWTEPTSGLTTNGAQAPTTNNLEAIDGYLIEFRYYQNRALLIDPSQILQIPDDYKDIVIAGVNALACEYLKRASDAMTWRSIYNQGIKEIVRDSNQFPHGGDFIRADGATVEQGFTNATDVPNASTTRTT